MEPNKTFEGFLESSEEATKKLLRTTFRHIADYEKSDKTYLAVQEIIFLTKPKTIGTLKLFLTTFRNFAIYTEDAILAAIIEDLDADELFESIRQTFDIGKYFTYQAYQEVLQALEESQEDKSLHYKALLMSLYEGIKSNNHFVQFINLRAKDIGEGRITLHHKKSSFSLAVSNELCENLKELSLRNTYTRNAKADQSTIPIVGKYADSCFKVEIRQTNERVSPQDSTYENVLRGYIREKIAPLFGYKVKAMDIYMSGLLHRAAVQLEEEGLAKNSPDSRPREILKAELRRCNHNVTIDNLRKSVTGHIHEIAAEASSKSLLSRLTDTSIDRIQAEEEADDDFNRNIAQIGSEFYLQVETSEPRPKKELRPYKGRMSYPRSMAVAADVLARADYQCEIDSTHTTFISNKTGKPYMEIHHLVPIAYSDCFDYDLDVPANAIALCCNCHRKIHFGREKMSIIQELYAARSMLLAQAGINIDFEALLAMYGISH